MLSPLAACEWLLVVILAVFCKDDTKHLIPFHVQQMTLARRRRLTSRYDCILTLRNIDLWFILVCVCVCVCVLVMGRS